MGTRKTFLVVALLAVTSTAASAQPGFTPRPEKNPYRDLFGEPVRAHKPTPSRKLATPAPSLQKPSVVCGMLMLRPDPSVDPKIRVAPPDGVEHTMRIVIPPICKPE